VPARYAVLGSPIAHSLSPAMQRAAFAALGIDATYEALEVRPAELGATLGLLHSSGFRGLNLTAPLKEVVWSELRGATADAERSRSVNTLKRVDGGWEGHATDGGGFAASVKESGPAFAGARVALLGAGGAARAVGPMLAALGASAVTVAARDASRAAAIAAQAERSNGGTAWSALALGHAPPAGSFEILLRALSAPELALGEEGWWDAVVPRGSVLDLNYGARVDLTRRLAGERGLRFEDGRGMLLHQGALSFQYWTGEEAPLGAMRRALEDSIP
jgi:shikimate dehydrogenase